ncbi:MAG: hypothetical protein V1914_02445 [archaeon]
MANITLATDSELEQGMKAFPWVKWSEATREMLLESLKRRKALEELDDLLKDSKLTDKDCEKFGKMLKREVWKSIKKESGVK